MQSRERKAQNHRAKFTIIPRRRRLIFPGTDFALELKKGFTLLETVAALAIIVLGIIGPVVLVTQGLVDFSSSKNKLIAVNLAQEGIELIRLVRDNNVLCDFLKKQEDPTSSWSWRKDPEGIKFSSQEELEGDVFNFHHCVSCGSASLHFPHLSNYQGRRLKYDNITGLYNYSSGVDTPFTRKIEIKVPPEPALRDGDIDKKDQMDVIVTVEWKERGRTRSVVLRDRLYNWR